VPALYCDLFLEPVAGLWVGRSPRGWPPLPLRLIVARSAARANSSLGSSRPQPKELSYSPTAC
jgi:hypothetical protein